MTTQPTLSTRYKWLSAMLLTSVLAATPAWAGHPKHEQQRGKHDWHSQQHMERLAKKLDLSDGQREQIKQNAANHHEQLQPLRDQKRALREEMRELQTRIADEATIVSIASRKGQLSEQMTAARLRMQADFLNVLTPQQREQLAAMKAERKEKWRQKREQRHPQQKAE